MSHFPWNFGRGLMANNTRCGPPWSSLGQLVVGYRLVAAGAAPANPRRSAEHMAGRAVLLPEVAGFAVGANVDAHGSAWLLGGKCRRLELGPVAQPPSRLATSLRAIEAAAAARRQRRSADWASYRYGTVMQRGIGLRAHAEAWSWDSASAVTRARMDAS